VTFNRNLLYGRRWRKARALYIANNPLCVFCQQQGRAVTATELDHIKPHKGDESLFWDESNWQGLCRTHHDTTKARIERGGKDSACDVKGNPIGRADHWT
jgi:5-methylcytosine-specific restriction endonuclease McrA